MLFFLNITKYMVLNNPHLNIVCFEDVDSRMKEKENGQFIFDIFFIDILSTNFTCHLEPMHNL